MRARVLAATFGICILVPTLGFAQASIAGLVRDSSGAVLPGVTVEASSTVLIERVRSAVTDAAVAFLVPGVNAAGVDVGGVSTTTAQPTLTAHGSRTGEGRVQMDGFGIGSPTVRGGADRSQYLTNVVNTEETVVSTSGVSGEAENGGLQLNLVPREGGNTVRGLFLTAGSRG